MKIKASRTQANSNKPKVKLQKAKDNQSSSLLEKIASGQHFSEKQKSSGILKVEKLQDVFGDKCLYGSRCAHLRAQGQCFYLHQKRDYNSLGLDLPEKYLEDEEPAKKSKKERKEDKLKELAQRQNRLKEKIEREQKQHLKTQEMDVEENQENNTSLAKVIDDKQVLIQALVSLDSQTPKMAAPVTELYKRLNILSDCYKHRHKTYKFSGFEQTELPKFDSLGQIRRRVLLKLSKNAQFKKLQKQFVQRQGGIVKKLIKNTLSNYSEQLELSEQSKSLDLTEIEELISFDQIQRIMKTKKENEDIVEYYSRFFSEDYGFPANCEINPDSQEESNEGGLYPINDHISLLIVMIPEMKCSRKFIVSNASYLSVKMLSQFTSLETALRIQDKAAVQKIITLNCENLSFSSVCEQLMSEYLCEYHKKMKPPSKFVFGEPQQNIRRFSNFVEKYYSKIRSEHSENTVRLIIYGVKDLLDEARLLGIDQKLTENDFKRCKNLKESICFERLFALRKLFECLKPSDSHSELTAVYIDRERIKMKKYRELLCQIDNRLQETEN